MVALIVSEHHGRYYYIDACCNIIYLANILNLTKKALQLMSISPNLPSRIMPYSTVSILPGAVILMITSVAIFS